MDVNTFVSAPNGGEDKTLGVASSDWPQSLIDALDSHVAIVDRDGFILAVNRAWKRFGRENGANPAKTGVGANYFRVCEDAEGMGAKSARAFASAVKDVLEHRIVEYTNQYTCSAPGGVRWFRGRVVLLEGANPACCLITHVNITESVVQSEDPDDLQLLVEQVHDEAVEGLSRALDLRHHETEEHCRRVTALTIRLARKLGVSEADLLHIRRGALLHDIGKMGIPDSVLLKSGPFSDDDRKVMETHPDLRRKILASIEFLRPALDIPCCHHEKWDGSGYPLGLKGLEIPLSARIFAAVDVWDALNKNRHYREAWSKEETLAHIQSLSGTHLDPSIVDIFLDMLREDLRRESLLHMRNGADALA